MAECATVKVAHGAVKGRKTTSKAGSPYYSFQGVPYAKPPVGPLRFEVAQPPEPWQGEKEALTTGPICRQFDLLTMKFIGEEDCLYLNVYTPELPSSGGVPRPVLVWIHGGGFVLGSGNPDFYGPDFLVDAGVVIVTINYRLNVLGFLYLEDSTVPGNIGLKDQVLALKWVQQNIAQFGGDPNSITIFGESAGGASVHYHMLSPMSKGLFHRAIAQSGSALNSWAVSAAPREMAFRLGELLGYKGNTSQELVAFLRTVDPATLVKTALEALSARDKKRLLAFAFVPTLEVEVDGVERFLPASPKELLEQGHYHPVPFITGANSAEGAFLLKLANMYDPEKIKMFNNEFEKIVVPDLRLPEDYSKSGEVAAKIKDYFFEGRPLSSDNIKAFVDMYSDILFSEGIITSLKEMALHSKAPLFLYNFSYKSNLPAYKNKVFSSDFPGASHGDDLGYLFRMDSVDLDLDPEAPEAQTRSRLIQMWVNFAKTGNPTPEVNPLVSVTWPIYSAANPNYLEIGETLVLGQAMLKDRMAFWEELYRSA